MSLAAIERELLGRVWDTWGALSLRQQRRVTRRHPLLAKALNDIQRHVSDELLPRGGVQS